MAEDSKSIGWIVGASMILVAYLGWGMMAGGWAGLEVEAIESAAGSGRVRTARGFGLALMVAAVVNFLVVSVTQLPEFFDVLSWHFTDRIWVPILIVLLEGALLAGGVALYRLEKTLNAPARRNASSAPPLPLPSDAPRKKRRRKKRRPRPD